MRVFAALAAFLLMVASAEAQGIAKFGKNAPAAKKSEQDIAREEAKRRAEDQAYQDAIRTIPNATTKTDPWRGMR